MPFGLQNTGAICWMNSLLQVCLIMPIKQDLIEHKYIDEKEHIKKNKLLGSIFATKLSKVTTLRSRGQEGCHEALTFLIDILKTNKFDVNHIQIYTCKKCKHEETKTDLCYIIDQNVYNYVIVYKNCKICKSIQKHKIVETYVPKNKILVLYNIKYPNKIKEKIDNNNNIYVHTASIFYTGGHYYCETKENNKYYNCDDNRVKKINGFTKGRQLFMVFYVLI